MAVARKGNSLFFATAGDVDTSLLRATTLVCTGDGTNAGEFSFKNGAGDVMLAVHVPAVAAGSPTVAVPINTDLYGLEMDAIPTNGVATLFIK